MKENDTLKRLGVLVDEIKQSSLSSINVGGTPTLILVNSEGVVIHTWEGKLQAQDEAEILRKMAETETTSL